MYVQACDYVKTFNVVEKLISETSVYAVYFVYHQAKNGSARS